MPNQRNPNKTFVGVYIDKKAKLLAQKILRERDSNLTEFVYAKILELIESREDKIIERLKESDGRTAIGRKKKAKCMP